MKKKSKIKIVGNLNNGHEAGNIHDPSGIAPTVRENHGKITLVIDNKCQSRRVYDDKGLAPTLPSRGKKTGSNSPIVMTNGKMSTKNVVEKSENEEHKDGVTINYLDLFSGIGGFTKGLEEAGFKFGWHGFSEIDKYASQVYRRNFPDAKELGSIVNIDGRRLPHLNLITFGFPCQDLSIAGKRKGLEGGRSGLFFEAIRIIDENKPDYFIFENVKGLLSSNDGKDFETVLREISDIRYDLQWCLCNTAWVLPQNRERIYAIGHIRGQRRPEVFPITEGCEDLIEIQRKTREKWKGIQGGVHERESDKASVKGGRKGEGRPSGDLNQIEETKGNGQGNRIYKTDGASVTLNGNGGGQGGRTGLYQVDSDPTPLRWTRTEKGKEERRKSKENEIGRAHV